MHELSIARNLLDTVLDNLRKHQATSVVSVKVDVGHLSGVVPSALEFAFSCLKEETPARDARLEINYIMPQYVCRSCNEVTEPDEPICRCPNCSDFKLEVRSGFELNLVSMEVDTDV